jgi:hypothetical protein
MAIAYVDGGAATSASPITVTYTTTAGNLLVALAYAYSATATFAMSDSGSGSWTAGAVITNGTYRTALFYKENSPSITTATVTITNGGGTMRLVLGEWSGIATSSSYEAHNEGSAASNNTVNSGNFTVTTGDLIVGGCYCSGGSLVQGSGFTLHANSTSGGILGLESKVLAGTTASASFTGAWSALNCHGAGFLPASGAATLTISSSETAATLTDTPGVDPLLLPGIYASECDMKILERMGR